MKLQHLAVIFIIIVVPIALVLSTYTDGLIKVINNEAHYDTVLTNATYDSIRAYQLNTLHNSFASVNNSRERDINASVNSFFNSLALGLEKSGYSKEELNEYIPAMLFTLYDGYYVYGPYKNIGNIGTVGTGLKRAQYSSDDNTRLEYGLMPYTYYSCEYQKNGNFDIVVNYSLDNYISISGTVEGPLTEDGSKKYITAAGYYINSNNVEINESDRKAIIKKGDRDITITPETLGEYIAFTDEIKVTDVNGRPRIVKQKVHETPVYYNYINYNEVKYYLMPSSETMSSELNTSYDDEKKIPIFILDNDVRVFINDDMVRELAKDMKFSGWDTNPENLYLNPDNFKDVNAFNYYKNAKEFSETVHKYLKHINVRDDGSGVYGDVKSVFFNKKYEIYPKDRNGDDYNSAHVKISYTDITAAYPFDFTLDENDPEEEISIFNNHRIDVIVSSIESSLVNAIGNFNNYVSNTYSYAMPTLSENDWYKIANNLTTVSFMQGLPVGRMKFYSNYSVVTNKKNKEFIGRDAIYIQQNVVGSEENYKTRNVPEYHSPSCEEFNNEVANVEAAGSTVDIIGYRNIDYEEEPVLNTYPKVLEGSSPPVLENDGNDKRIEITQSLNYYFQPGTGGYECIISRNQNRITTDDLIGQKSTKTVRRGNEETSTVLKISEKVQTAYISALAREKGASYKHHSGLNYHRYMYDASHTLGENTNKTYNDIDQNFSDENHLNVPTVTDPTYNGEVVPPSPPVYPTIHTFNGKVVTIKVDETKSSSELVTTDIAGTPRITSILDRNIVTNDKSETGDISENTIIGKTVGQTDVFLSMTASGTTYSARTRVIVIPKDTPAPPAELDSETIKIFEIATAGEREITSTRVTMLTNEEMNIRAQKTDSRDVLTATSSDINKIQIKDWNNTTDRGKVKAYAKTLNPVTVTVSGNMTVKGTGSVATASFECDIVDQVISIGDITIAAGETKRLGTDSGADIKIDLVKEEKLIYELYTTPENNGVATLDPSTGKITGNRQGLATLKITGEISGASRQVLVRVTDDRTIYYATLHRDGTLAFANSEAASKISGKVVDKVYNITLANEQKFMTNQTENNSVSEVRFIEPITVRGQKIEWFTNWPNLVKLVDENKLVTDNIKDMRKMFYQCSKLQGDLNLNTWNTSNVQYMENMFEKCSSITGISLSNWNTQNVRNMKYMFKDCEKLKSITANATATSWNVGNVLSMEYMFNGCKELKTAILNNWDAGNVDNMEYMFTKCSSLENINISTWNTRSLRNVRFMFSECTALKSVMANSSNGNWTTANVENMSNMFGQCSNVTTFALANWDTRKAHQMQSIFTDCTSIQDIDLSSWITSAKTPTNQDKTYETMFNNCLALRRLNLQDWILGQNVVSMFNNCKALQTGYFNIARVNTVATTDMANMFSNCESLTSLSLPVSGDYWNVSNVTRMLNMFRGCKGLTSINLTNWDVRNVKTMINMFTSCESLTSINLESWNNEWYNDDIDLTSMFSYCKKLRNLYLTGLVNQHVSKIANMFESCEGLTSFSWNSWNWNVSKVTDMSSFLRGCENLTTVDLDLARAGGEITVNNLNNFYTSCRKLTNVSMTNWKANNITSVNTMFYDCKILASVTMSNWEVEKITTLERMLADREKLTTVNMSGWKAPNLSYIQSVFSNSQELISVNMSGWNTPKLTSLGSFLSGKEKLTTANFSNWTGTYLTNLSYMFYGCIELRTADFGNTNTYNVTDMRYMFNNCRKLQSVNFNALNTTSVSMYNLDGMFFGCPDSFTIVINVQENTAGTTRGKLRRAYDESAETYYYNYSSSNRYRVFGHYPNRRWNGINWWGGDDYTYYWSGTVNFIY